MDLRSAIKMSVPAKNITLYFPPPFTIYLYDTVRYGTICSCGYEKADLKNQSKLDLNPMGYHATNTMATTVHISGT